MATYRTNRVFDVFFLLTLAGFIWWAYINRVAITDQVFFWNYQPSTKTTQIATAAGLSPAGRRLLYRTDPQFTNLAEIKSQCDIERLGCINQRGQTFILDDPSKPSVTIVTAAHEMLHLVYRRLPQDKKEELAPLLDQAIAQNSILGIELELKFDTSPEDRHDEAHSLLGTEYKNLPAELETYYAHYFSERTKVVAAQSASK